MNNQINGISELGIVRKVLDWLWAVYLIIDLVAILGVGIQMINGLNIGAIILYILTVLMFVFGLIALLPIKPITSIYQKKLGAHWKIFRTFIIILPIFVSSILIRHIMFDCYDRTKGDFKNIFEVIEETKTIEENDISDVENPSQDDNMSSSTIIATYTGDEAISKAKEYFVENEGDYDDMHIDMHMISIEKDFRSEGDYRIAGNGFSPVSSKDCVRIDEESDGTTTYYFLEDCDFCTRYIKMVCGNPWVTIYYGDSIDQCNKICGQF